MYMSNRIDPKIDPCETLYIEIIHPLTRQQTPSYIQIDLYFSNYMSFIVLLKYDRKIFSTKVYLAGYCDLPYQMLWTSYVESK